MNYKKKNTSFTLIELLVVIVIIGVLAGVIMVTTSSSVSSATLARAKAFSSNVQNSMLLNLISEWKFDESSDPYKDSWGINSCSLVVPLGVTSPELKDDCVFGSCLYFFNMVGTNEPGSYLNCGSLSYAINIWTQELWIKSSMTGRMPMTLGKASVYGSSGIAWSGNTWYPGIGNVYDEKWHHLTFTYSYDDLIGGNNIFAYVDGKLVAQGNRDWSSIISPVLIGKGYDWGGNDYPYRHYIDEVKIYNTYLSSSQIKQNYIGGLNSMLANGTVSEEEYNQRLEALAEK